MLDKLDILNRGLFVEQLMRLVESIAERKSSVSFAINGTWGCGKSFVFDMFEERLAQIRSEETLTDKYLIIRYNCWKYDYYEEPLIAIVASIMETVNKKTKFLYGERGEKIKGVLRAVGTTLLSISNNTFKAATGIDASEVYDVVKSGINSGKVKFEKMQKYDVFFSFNQTLHSLHNVLNEISEQYTLVFLVDELDRCLPKYAIKVLERLHHLTEETKNIINIIAIDKRQLQISIRHIFGFKNANGYLKKFIHFSIPLDVGAVSEKIIDKYYDYISLFDAKWIPFKDSIEEFLQNLFMNIDVREQEQLIQRTMLVHKLLYSGVKDYSFMCMELLIVVVEFYYNDNKMPTEFRQSTDQLPEDVRKEIPFASFLNDKFDKIPRHEIHDPDTKNTNVYVLLSTDSLYAAIAYTWYELFLEDSLESILIEDETIKNLLKNNAEKLKRFVEMIRLIK